MTNVVNFPLWEKMKEPPYAEKRAREILEDTLAKNPTNVICLYFDKHDNMHIHSSVISPYMQFWMMEQAKHKLLHDFSEE